MSSKGAPATIVSPDTATDQPRSSPAAPSPAVSLVCVAVAQVPPGGRTNTYADPRSLFVGMSSKGAPATIVSPDTAADQPSPSPLAPSPAVSLAASKNGSIVSG